jgi:hypothetical protein
MPADQLIETRLVALLDEAREQLAVGRIAGRG